MSKKDAIDFSELEDGSDRLDALVTSHPLPTWRGLSWTIMILIASGLGWAFTARLDEVTVATGTVKAAGENRVIQHLEGGIIAKIFVREGSKVAVGDDLVLLDIASTGRSREKILAEYDGKLALRSRLTAEAAKKSPVFPKDVRDRHPKLVSAQKKAFADRQRELKETLNVLGTQVRQRQLEVKELKAKRKSIGRNLQLAEKRLQQSAELLKDKLVPEVEHLKLQAEVEDLKSEFESLGTSIPRVQESVNEAKARRDETNARFRREAQQQLSEVEEEIARLNEDLAAASEKGARLAIKSPIAGVIKNMRYQTIGGVVIAGEPILEIVPSGEKLVIDAKLNPLDRGFVVEGQPARVKISTYDFIRYGALEGKVAMVAPDVTEDDENPFFQVIIETEKSYLGEKEGELPITAGMEATVDIHTGTKSVIDFLIKPVLKMKAEAFRER